jgi:hypothetical protein
MLQGGIHHFGATADSNGPMRGKWEKIMQVARSLTLFAESQDVETDTDFARSAIDQSAFNANLAISIPSKYWTMRKIRDSASQQDFGSRLILATMLEFLSTALV